MSRYDDDYWGYPPYVSVAEKRANNAKMAAKLAKKNRSLRPVVVEGTKIAKTFWGKAWCDNVESYRDYENRLPRGRSYVRHGAVLDLQISAGLVTALVAGSAGEPYDIKIEITPLPESRREALKKRCAGKVSSLLALAQGKLPPELLTEFCDRRNGLFPSPAEIKTNCSCPDWAGLCKHLAAVFYGIGARLDEEPALFFTLRGIDQNELVGAGAVESLTKGVASELAAENLADVFGVEFDTLEEVPPVKAPPKKAASPPPVFSAEWTPEKIYTLRKRLGYTQAEFAKRCKTSGPGVSQWESGKLPVTERFWKTLEKLSRSEPAPLADLRKRLGLSRAELGRRLGVTGQTIANWESGKTKIPPAQQKKIARLK